MELPSGTVTFLFTDLEGSTRLWEEQPDAMRPALARHDAILRDAIRAHDGHVVKTTGDGFHAVFARADDAVRAAVAAQIALGKATEAADVPLIVRMGLHIGAGEERDGDYFGAAVNRAARVMAVAHGGQVLASRAVHDLVGAELDDVELISLGEHRLRGVDQPLEIYQVVGPGLERAFPPLGVLGCAAGQPARAAQLVRRPRTGSGRRRGVARGHTHRDLDGSRWCRQDPPRVPGGGRGRTPVPPRRVAGRIGPGAGSRRSSSTPSSGCSISLPRPGVELIETLTSFLRSKELLLVLDNCEHLLAPVAALLRTLGDSCPGLVVLATSREGLGLAGERIVAVPSLGVPDSDECDVVAGSEAVRVFVERARAVKSDFTVTDENAVGRRRGCSAPRRHPTWHWNLPPRGSRS